MEGIDPMVVLLRPLTYRHFVAVNWGLLNQRDSTRRIGVGTIHAIVHDELGFKSPYYLATLPATVAMT